MIPKDKFPQKYFLAYKWGYIDKNTSQYLSHDAGVQKTLYVKEATINNEEFIVTALTSNKSEALFFTSRLKLEALTDIMTNFNKDFFILKDTHEQ